MKDTVNSIVQEYFAQFVANTRKSISHAPNEEMCESIYRAGFIAGYDCAEALVICNLCLVRCPGGIKDAVFRGWEYFGGDWVCVACTTRARQDRRHPMHCRTGCYVSETTAVSIRSNSGDTETRAARLAHPRTHPDAEWVDEFVPESLKPAFNRVLALIRANSEIIGDTVHNHQTVAATVEGLKCLGTDLDERLRSIEQQLGGK